MSFFNGSLVVINFNVLYFICVLASGGRENDGFPFCIGIHFQFTVNITSVTEFYALVLKQLGPIVCHSPSPPPPLSPYFIAIYPSLPSLFLTHTRVCVCVCVCVCMCVCVCV